jgi:hypothetical protein
MNGDEHGRKARMILAAALSALVLGCAAARADDNAGQDRDRWPTS